MSRNYINGWAFILDVFKASWTKNNDECIYMYDCEKDEIRSLPRHSKQGAFRSKFLAVGGRGAMPYVFHPQYASE